MATLDQLAAEQRAIVELVVQRGRSYDTLAEVLQVPFERVRELARDALAELSPRTAARVDPDWRGQIADYLLGQQSSVEARATRDYLKRSETGRAWALSLLDSLDPLYENGSMPAVPEPDPEAEAPEKPRERPTAAAATVEERVRERERARRPERKTEPARKREPLRKPAAEKAPPREALSPEAQDALRRRRVRGAAAGVVLLAAVVVGILALAGAFSSDDKGSKPAGSTTGSGTSTTAAGGQPIQVLGQIALQPVGKTSAKGLAYIIQQGGTRSLVVQAQVPPLPSNQKVAAYEVWLYNSNGDARSLGAQYTDRQGILQGRANLPSDFAKFKAIDISRELFDKNTAHSNNSVLRGTFASLQPVPQQQQGGATSTTPTTPPAGTGTTP